MGVYLSSEELKALHGLSLLHFKLYVILRTRMDCSNFMVGLKPRISYSALKEELEVNCTQGIKKYGKPTTAAIKHSLLFLQKRGLISLQNDQNYLILYCSKYAEYKYAQIKTYEDKRGLTKDNYNEKQNKTINNKDLENKKNKTLTEDLGGVRKNDILLQYTDITDITDITNKDISSLHSDISSFVEFDNSTIVSVSENETKNTKNSLEAARSPISDKYDASYIPPQYLASKAIPEALNDISLSAPTSKKAKKIPSTTEDVILVFEHWKKIMQKPRACLDDKRIKFVKNALKLGYTVEELKTAIDGCARTPHNMGVNDRQERYDGMHIIFRDSDQIERFIANSSRELINNHPLGGNHVAVKKSSIDVAKDRIRAKLINGGIH